MKTSFSKWEMNIAAVNLELRPRMTKRSRPRPENSHQETTKELHRLQKMAKRCLYVWARQCSEMLNVLIENMNMRLIMNSKHFLELNGSPFIVGAEHPFVDSSS